MKRRISTWMTMAAVVAATPALPAPGETVEVVPGGVTALPDALEATPYSVQLAAPEGVEGTWVVCETGYSAWLDARVDGFEPSASPMGWRADEGCWRLELPFAFPFFGQEYTVAWVGSNGTIEFGEEGRLGYSVDEETLKQTTALAAMWADLDTSSGDIRVASSPLWVEVAWHGKYYGGGGAANFSARLYPDGKIGVMFGEGNAEGGLVGVSGGPGFENAATILPREWTKPADTVFAPFKMPEGLSFDADTHELATGGAPIGEAGIYSFGLSIDTGDGETADSVVALRVGENSAVRPVFTDWSPWADCVNLAEGGESGIEFSVLAETADQRTVAYRWFLDGEAQAATGRTFTLKAADTALHVLAAEASADGMKSSRREWSVGVLRFAAQPSDATVSAGQRAVLECAVESSLPASVTWFQDTAPGEDEVGTGTRLVLEDVREDATYFARAESSLGTVDSARATVTASQAPALGRICKLTGPAFEGNRLVLRAKAYGGDLERAEFTWKRDGKTAGYGERLEIASLGADDFGTYTLQVLTHEGGAESAPFVLSPAASGAPLGWGADAHGRTQAPEGLTGVAEIASGMNFNVALKTDGTVAAWGYNGHGGCDVPEELSGVSSVAAGGYGSRGAGFAVKTDGSVTGWGQSYEDHREWNEWAHSRWDEELGEWVYEGDWDEWRDGCDLVGGMPDDLGDVVQVAVGSEFAVALRADGSVSTWSKYGDMDDDPYAVPGEAEDVVAVAAGATFALALRADGRVVAWGDAESSGCLEVPENLGEVVAVTTTKERLDGSAAFALRADGTVASWGQGTARLDGVEELSGVAAIDAGQEHVIALSADGKVRVWSYWNDYGEENVPAGVAGAMGIAAGGYHCTAIVPDTDGDTIPDALEPLYGRDPEVWEDWHRTQLSGTVAVDGGALRPENGEVSVFDAAGNCLAGAAVDEDTGRYAADGLVPGRYFVFAAAENAADDWAGHVAAPIGFALPPDSPWSFGDAPVAVGPGASAPCDFDLAPGQARAWCQVVPVAENPDPQDWNDRFAERPLPDGVTVYLDMWPVAVDAEGRFDLGEVAASHAVKPGDLALLPHVVTFKDPSWADGRPSPDNQVHGVEGYMVKATPVEPSQECMVSISTAPGGAEVWIDRADEPLGTTPLEVYGLAAGSHALLLRKEGFLRPRPIEFVAETGYPLDIEVALHAEGGDVAPLELNVDAGLPETPIYLDYLPTGLTTPARVGGMDPVADAGWNWRSVSHSILLRREGSRPYAARAVPDDLPDSHAVCIVGANQYDDDDGDGIRNDREAAIGNDPSDASNGGRGPLAVVTNRLPDGVSRPIRVPVSWVAQHPAFHGRFQGLDDLEARRELARKILEERAQNQRRVWECYVAGLDPADPDADLRMWVARRGGLTVVQWRPCYPGNREGGRYYTVEATTNLVAVAAPGNAVWGIVNDIGTNASTLEDATGNGTAIGWAAITNGTGGAKSAGSGGTWFYRIGVDLPEEPEEP